MTVAGHELLDRLRAGPPDAAAFDHLAEFLRTAHTDDIDRFASSTLEVAPAGGTFLDSTLSHVSCEGFARLVDKSVALLESGTRSEACEAIIAYASLQLPQALQPHLRRLFVLRSNAGTYYENWPWRGATEADVSFLSWSLQASQTESRAKAWECLLETRRPDAISMALDRADHVDLDVPVASYLHTVGFDTPHERLYRESCQHISFPPDYFRDDRPSWNSRSLHPSWRLAAGPEEFAFGGSGSTACGLCSQTLHHLISLPASCVFDDPHDHSTVRLEACLSCLGWVEACLFYRHAADGTVSALNVGTAKPEFVAEPLLETRVRLASTPDRWRWQDWGLSNARENLHRVGGHPCWIQSADFPACKSCNKRMHFVMQLDSDLPTVGGGEWLWGSGGTGYGFCCKDCRITAFHWQCT